MSYGIRLNVSGDFACFTRPEMKVERVSYDVMTPSAARGILEAIYWKPQIRWVVDRIRVQKPIRFTNIRRNEVAAKATNATSESTVGMAMLVPGIVIESSRQQRAATILCDVAYVIEAHFEILDHRFQSDGKPIGETECAGKHLDMFNRRARAGQCFHQPYFGAREFPARFKLIEPGDSLPASELPDDQRNRLLGWMLHDFAFIPADDSDKESFLTSRGKRVRTEARFFNAELREGAVDVPPFKSAIA